MALTAHHAGKGAVQREPVKKSFLHQYVTLYSRALMPRYGNGMSIIKRLTAIIASGFALAATPEAQAWKEPSPLGPGRPTPSVTPPPQLPDPPETTTVEPPPLALRASGLVVFASGFALAAVVAVGLWMLPGADSSPVAGKPKTSIAPPQPAALASGKLATCPLEPAAAAASEKDGKFPLQASVEGLIAADIKSFIFIGNEAAAAGRPRDAEAAFLMACRVADKLGGAGSVESADAKYQLGSHYARLALGGGVAGDSDRVELLRRAEPLYLESLQTSIARYGEAHEKSQQAAKGLAAVRQAPTPMPTPTPGPAQAQAQIMPPAPSPKLATRVEASEKPPKLAPPVAGAAPGVSPLPPAEAQGKNRQRPPAIQKCLPAVATLGLCSPGM